MSHDRAFEHDLRRWVHRFYVEREQVAAQRSRLAVDRIFDRERHVLTWLSAQLMACIALSPWWGAQLIIAGLAILYLGTFISGFRMIRKERRVSQRRSPRAIEADAERALAACPPLDADARALLIRLMNLAALRPTPRSMELLREELRDTLGLPELRRWPFLHELLESLESRDSRAFQTLRPRPAD